MEQAQTATSSKAQRKSDNRQATRKSDAKAAATAAPAKKPNARQHLRDLFPNVGDVRTKEQVFGYNNEKGEYVPFHAVTIRTHLTDLKNPVYAGKAGCMNIVAIEDGAKYKRVELSNSQK